MLVASKTFLRHWLKSVVTFNLCCLSQDEAERACALWEHEGPLEPYSCTSSWIAWVLSGVLGCGTVSLCVCFLWPSDDTTFVRNVGKHWSWNLARVFLLVLKECLVYFQRVCSSCICFVDSSKLLCVSEFCHTAMGCDDQTHEVLRNAGCGFHFLPTSSLHFLSSLSLSRSFCLVGSLLPSVCPSWRCTTVCSWHISPSPYATRLISLSSLSRRENLLRRCRRSSDYTSVPRTAVSLFSTAATLSSCNLLFEQDSN